MAESNKHLRRLDRVFSRNPIFFITTTTAGRKPVLNSAEIQGIFEEVWNNGWSLYGWSVGPYVIMPDHVHFFCRRATEESASLATFVGKWKEWTSKFAHRRLDLGPPLWQAEFFDHVLRNEDSLREKIAYVRENPVRAGLAEAAENWTFRGNPGNWGVRDGD